jgi:hypothetical protein
MFSFGRTKTTAPCLSFFKAQSGGRTIYYTILPLFGNW